MVTLAQVAKRAGVAQSTVSQVLRGNAQAARISLATQRRVHDAARKLHYRPNAYAQAVREGRFGCVGLILSDVSWRSTLPAEQLAGLIDALASRNTHLSVARLRNDLLESEDFMPKILATMMTDGLLIDITQDAPPRMTTLIEQHRIPHVWLNSMRKADCVHPDDRGGAALLVRELIGRGHRRIAYANFAHGTDHGSDHYSVADRYEGAAAAMRDAGLTLIDWRHQAASSTWVGFAAQRLAADRPTAVISYGPSEPAALLIAAAGAGLVVPRDLSLVTFHHTAVHCGGVALAHARDNRYDLGRLAVDMLLARIAGAPAHATVTTPYTLDPGATLAVAPT